VYADTTSNLIHYFSGIIFGRTWKVSW